jgi:hypothetical protein
MVSSSFRNIRNRYQLAFIREEGLPFAIGATAVLPLQRSYYRTFPRSRKVSMEGLPTGVY